MWAGALNWRINPPNYRINQSHEKNATILSATELAVWLTALLKLLGHAVRLGGCLAINVVSFPAIKKQFPVGNCCAAALGFSWPAYGDSGFLDHDEAKREPDMGEDGWRAETEVQKDKRRKQVSLSTETKPKKRNLHRDPMRDVRGWSHHSGPIWQPECDLRLRL